MFQSRRQPAKLRGKSEETTMQIAIIGGTGREGRGLALRWARRGHRVALGSRDRARAEGRAAELTARGEPGPISGGDNDWAVTQAEVVVLTVPYEAHAATLQALRPALTGRVLIDITVPLCPPRVHCVQLPLGHSAALEAQAILGEATPVVSALHHVSSAHLGDPDFALTGDVLVCSDSDAARATAMALVSDLGVRALDAGPLCNAIALESLTPILIHLNKHYRSTGAAVRFVGI
jgi:NADPH-dependent F420 reductase